MEYLNDIESPVEVGTVADGESVPVALLLREYDRLKEEQLRRIATRDHLLYLTVAAAGGTVVAAIQLGAVDMALLLPPVCVLLGWTYLVNDEKISAIGRYIRTVLAAECRRLAEGEPARPFGWEQEHRRDRRRRSRKLSQLFVDLSAFCLPAGAALGIYWGQADIHAALLVVSVLEAGAVIFLAYQIIGHADLSTAPGRRP